MHNIRDEIRYCSIIINNFYNFLFFCFLLRNKLTNLIIIVSFSLVTLYAGISFGRFSNTIDGIFNNPYYLFFEDQSVAHRVLGIFVGLFTIIENPIGFGAGSYTCSCKNV